VSPAAIVFYLLSAVAVVSALMVVWSRNAIHSAIYLVLSFLSVAGLYVQLEAEFVAAVQVLVYAGGIMVLFLFVIMLVNLRDPLGDRLRLHATISGSMGLLVVAAILAVYRRGDLTTNGAASTVLRQGGNLEAIGEAIFSDYLLPFEIASILLLVARVAVVVLARQDRKA
jgi:NADH-quinone oxidoreductase subunit J